MRLAAAGSNGHGESTLEPVTSNAVQKALVHLVTHRELVVVIPRNCRGACPPRHCLCEADVLQPDHGSHVEQSLLREDLVDAHAACLHGSLQGEPVATHDMPACLKLLSCMKLRLRQAERFAVDEAKPDAALDPRLVCCDAESDDVVDIERGGELLERC